jgi:hypothetical protein
MRRAKLRVLQSTGWEDYDARVLTSPFVRGDLQTSSYPQGYVQLRILCRPAWLRLTAVIAIAIGVALLGSPEAALVLVGLAGVAMLWGLVSVRLLLRRIFSQSEAER